MKKVKIGCEVRVFDRYRFALPIEGVVSSKSQSNDGVEITLTTTYPSLNRKYPVGSSIWISRRQIRKIKE